MNLSYDYDYKNRLQNVKDSGTITASYVYDANGNRQTMTYNGQTANYVYNRANMLTELQNKSGSTVLSKYNYEYYTSGNQSKKIDSINGTTTYTYDGLGRLKTETAPTDTFGYTYNAHNNRATLTVTGSNPYSVSYAYDKNNRLTKEIKTVGATEQTSDFYYDKNGNMLSSLNASLTTATSGATPDSSVGVAGSTDGFSAFEYDGWNRQTKALVDNNIATYTYNADSLRTSKTVNGTITGFVLEGGYVVAETNSSGTFANKYVYGNGLIYSTTSGTKTFYNYNGHGDVTQLTNTSGTVTKNYNYDAFGNEVNPDANDTNPFRYCAEYFDKETNSIYLRARYYAPSRGRFSTEDPLFRTHINPVPDIKIIGQSTNLYLYCLNDPINYFDPSGLRLILTGNGDQVTAQWGAINDMSADNLELVQQTDADGNLIASYEVFLRGEVNGICQNGTDLVRRIINSDRICTVVPGTGGNSEVPADWDNAINGTGTNVTVTFNPNSDPDIMTVGANGTVSGAKRPAFIGLAHELIHADRDMRGRSLDYSLTAEYTYQSGRRRIDGGRTIVLSHTTQTAPRDELATVGLGGWARRGDITENMIRAEHGLRLRGAY